MTITDLYQSLFGKATIQDGDVISMAEHGRIGNVSTGEGYKKVGVISGLALEQFDYVSRSLAVDNITETWTFKSGGSGGTTTNIVVIVYTDSTLETISTVTKT